MNVTGLRVAVDWSGCFKLNGPLDSYELLENGLLTYKGPQKAIDLGTRIAGEYTYKAQATTLFQGRKLTVEAPLSDTVKVQSE